MANFKPKTEDTNNLAATIQGELLKFNSPVKDQITRMIKEIAKEEITKQLQGGLFTARKLTDTPTDNLAVVNRQYVNLSGLLSARPAAPVVGQKYFPTDTGIPMVYSAGGWRNGVGSVVA